MKCMICKKNEAELLYGYCQKCMDAMSEDADREMWIDNSWK